MRESIRRVNKLRFSSQSENNLHGDIAALQEAFRLASLPGIPPQGLLLVKSLDLGAFPTRSTAPALSRLIDHRIRNSAVTAIRADHGDFVDQPLVWFSDTATAAVALAENVAANRHPRAWYWRTLFPDWRPGMSLAATLVAIAAGLQAQAPAPAPAVLGQVIASLIATTPIDRLLDAIEPRLARSLLRQAGVGNGRSSVAAAGSAAPGAGAGSRMPPSAWHRPIAGALARWGGSDPRCLWLGYCALTAENPALALDPALLDRIETVLDGLAPAVDTDLPRDTGIAGDQSARPELPGTPGPPGAEAITRPAPRGTDRTRQREAATAPATVSANTQAARTEAPRPSTPPAQGRPSSSPAGADAPAGRMPDDPARRRRGESAPITPAAVDPAARPVTARTDADSDPMSFDGLVDSEYAGLAFVIRLLELLAVDRLTERYPALAEMNLPAVVVGDIARRLGIPFDHPLLRALPRLPPVETRLESFASPPSWRDLIAAPGGNPASLRLFATTASGSRFYLTDRSGRLLLYAGTGEVPPWTRHHPITRHDGVHPCPDPRALSPGVQLLIGRYLRRYGGISLRHLVRRPGRFASSRTHLDALFACEQTDIRIRRAGLDIDPGWVAWLARVVQIHYRDGESVDV